LLNHIFQRVLIERTLVIEKKFYNKRGYYESFKKNMAHTRSNG